MERTADTRIEAAKRGLDDKLAELERRAVETRAKLDLGKRLESPWVRLGLACAAGLIAGYARDTTPMRAILRLAVSAGTRVLVRDAIDRSHLT